MNGCRQNESLIKTSQHSSPSVNIRSWNKSSIKMILTKIRLQWKVHLLSSLTSKSSHLLVCSCFDLCRFLSWFRPEHFITGGRVIMGYFSCLYAVRITWPDVKKNHVSFPVWKCEKFITVPSLCECNRILTLEQDRQVCIAHTLSVCMLLMQLSISNTDCGNVCESPHSPG